MLFNNMVRVTVRVTFRIRFSVWLVIGYAQVFVLLSVAIVTLPHKTATHCAHCLVISDAGERRCLANGFNCANTLPSSRN